jgi:hypothetical protein
VPPKSKRGRPLPTSHLEGGASPKTTPKLENQHHKALLVKGGMPPSTAECHGWEWKKAINVTDPRERKGRPTGKFRDSPITPETTELEMFEELMPLSWMELLGRLRSNAVTNRDRNVHTLNDLKAWMAVTTGASSFKAGTNLCNKTQCGIAPPMNCDEHLSHGK